MRRTSIPARFGRARGDSGSSVVEYGLMIAGICVALVVVAAAIGRVMTAMFNANDATVGTDQAYVAMNGTAAPTGSAAPASTPTPTPTTPAPTTPAGLTATAGSGNIALNWNDVANATSYTVTGCGATFTTLVSSGTCTGLTNGTTYNVTVTATGPGGTSTAATATATPVAPPATPTGLTATGADATIALNWNDVTNATSYTVTGCGATFTTTASSGTCTGLANGTSYSISVTATGAGGTSGAATTTASPVAPPATPTGLAATPGDGTITLDWADMPNATSYTVTGCGATFTISTSAGTCTGLTNGTTYNVSVTATGAGGTSGAATVSAVPAVPVKKGGSKYTPTVGWTSDYSPTTGYTYSSCAVSPTTTGVSCGYTSGSRGASDALTLSTLSTAPSGSVVTLTWTFTTGGRNPKTYTESEVFVIS